MIKYLYKKKESESKAVTLWAVSLIFTFLFAFSLVTALDNDAENSVDFTYPLDVSTSSVNSSEYWDGLDTPADINAGDIINDGTYLAIDGSNADQNIDIGSYNLTASGGEFGSAVFIGKRDGVSVVEGIDGSNDWMNLRGDGSGGAGINYKQGIGGVNIYEGGTTAVHKFSSTGFIFNEPSYDRDFRIEGNGDANLFFTNGGTDSIGIGINNPVAKLEIKDNSITTGDVFRASSSGLTTGSILRFLANSNAITSGRLFNVVSSAFPSDSVHKTTSYNHFSAGRYILDFGISLDEDFDTNTFVRISEEIISDGTFDASGSVVNIENQIGGGGVDSDDVNVLEIVQDAVSTGNGIDISMNGGSGFAINVNADNDKIALGTGNDGLISWDGTDLILNSTTGSVNIYNQSGWGNLNLGNLTYNTKVYNKEDGSALTKVKDADEYLNPDGSINHSAFYCAVEREATDFSLPEYEIITKERCLEMPETRDIGGVIYKKGSQYCSDDTTNRTYYPHKKMVWGIDAECQANLNHQALYEALQIIEDLQTEINILKLAK